MKRLIQGGKRFIFDPIRLIEISVAIMALIGAVYIFTPLYQFSIRQNGLSPFAASLSHPTVVFAHYSVVLVSSLLILFGLYNRVPQLKSVGWFFLFLSRFFQVLVTILSVGWVPITWIYPLTIALICLILWVNSRLEVLRRHAVS